MKSKPKVLTLLSVSLYIFLSYNAYGFDTKAWDEYYDTSAKRRLELHEYLSNELRNLGVGELTKPKLLKNFGFDSNWSVEFFASDEGRRIADIVLSFQAPHGGWSKNVDMTYRQRAKGVAFGEQRKTYVSTIDNGATTSQLVVLAKAYAATRQNKYQDAFLSGLDFLFEAQYPNGGWPQNYPLDGKYHDDITYNDDAMTSVLTLLYSIIQSEPLFDFVEGEYQEQAIAAFDRGLDCVLRTQVEVDGNKTIWAAQYSPLTLEPAKARAYEPVSLASAESAEILLFLMQITDPSRFVIEAVESGVMWLQQHALVGYEWKNGELKTHNHDDPLWSRFYEIETHRPIFGDRDGKVYYDVSQISQERRDGYAWYGARPSKVLERYALWQKSLPSTHETSVSF